MSTRSIDDYIQQKNMDTTGWLSDVELQFIASLLQIKIYVFTTVNWRSCTRKWIAYAPVFRTEDTHFQFPFTSCIPILQKSARV